MKSRFFPRWCRLVFALAAVAALVPLVRSAAEAAENLPTNSLTLDAAVRLALANNPTLRASGARVEAASWRAYQAKLWSNPELELSAEDWSLSGGGFSKAKQTIGVAQSLPYPGKKSLDRQIGGAGVKLSEAELAVRRTELVRDVKAGFARVLAGERLLEVSTQLVAAAESSALIARKRVEAGAAPYQEQLRAEVQLEQTRTELADYERELATARQVFLTLVGAPDLQSPTLVGSLAETAEPSLVSAPPTDWLARHPSALSARAQLDRAQLEYRRAKLEPYPDVKLGVSGGRIGETDEPILQVGLTLPLPIIDRGKGRAREAWANVTVAEAETQVVQQQLQREWRNAQRRYHAAIEQVTSYRDRILPKANEALRLVQTGFEQGKFGFTDLADTQRTTGEVRLAYQQKLLEMNIAQAEVEALLRPQTNSLPPHQLGISP